MLGTQGAKLGDEGRAGLGGRFPGGLGHRCLLGDHEVSIGGFPGIVKGLFWATYARRGARPRRPCPPRRGAARG